MLGSYSRSKIVEKFDATDRRLTVMSFDKYTGKRVMTYSGLNIFQAMQEIAQRTSNGFEVRIFADLSNAEEVETLEEAISTYGQYLYRPLLLG